MDAAHELIWGYSYGAVTIEAICDRAKVKKGSFYYFFDSKSDLAVAAINAWWEERKSLIKELFQPEVAPLNRIAKYLDFVASVQLEAYAETGQVLGCPIFAVGSEICTQDDRILALIREIIAAGPKSFEVAIREAQIAGDAEAGDPALKARVLWAFYEGTLTRARIENNPELIRNLSSDALELVGARSKITIEA